jgi:starch-binding outer membrane protein, SusD/RagB family
MKKTFFLIIGLCIFILSCKKSFLEEPPRTVTIDQLIKNPGSGAERILGAVYSRLYDWPTHGFSWIGVTSITSDEADKGSTPGDGGADKAQLDNWIITSNSLSLSEVWEGHFEGVGRACYAVELIGQMELPTMEKERYIGEAKFLRAYYYWNLVRIFGGVPLIDKVLSSQNDIETASVRSSQDAIYDFIESDLRAAVTSLPQTISRQEYGRPSRGAAQMFLSKVYLYREKWGLSKSMIDQVIDSRTYDLVADYRTIWRESGEFSKESLWEVNAVTTNPTRGLVGYSEVQGMRGSGDGDFGWGFNVPSASLIASYETGDIRKDGTILQSGTTLWDGYSTSSSLPNPFYNYKAYVSRISETNFNRNESNKNLRVFRFGEALLIKAEVENELGDTTASKTALNQLRQRAGLKPIFAKDKSTLRDKIFHERYIEMAMEHDRLFDLRRTRRAGTILRAQGKPYVDGKHDLFPIPQRQIDLSGGKLSQNPGYD